MTTESKGLPSRLGVRVRNFNKKVIVLFMIILFSLPTQVVNALVLLPSYSVNVTLRQQEKNTEKQEKAIKKIVDDYVKELKEQGYQNISYELSAFYELSEKYLIKAPRDLPSTNNNDISDYIKNSIIKGYNYYTIYNTIKIDDNIYLFKTIEELENFKNEILKYDNINYDIDTTKDVINKETTQDVLNKVITQKKDDYEKRKAAEEEARRRAEEERLARLKAQQDAEAAKRREQQLYNIDYSNAIVNYALQFNGNPYVYGGNSLTNGTDCSGFTQGVYRNFGIYLPRTARDQASVGITISYDNIQPGDLVFYSGNGGYSITHVAIYIGGGKIIHAQTPSDGIGITSANIMTLMTIKRVI